METLEDRIKAFVSLNPGSGDGSGDGSGYGYDSGEGCGYGYRNDYVSGDGNEYGCDFGCGPGCGSGYGGFGDGFGDGDDDDDGYGVKEVNGDTVYIVDDVPTIIKSVRDNIAQGFILQRDLTQKPCYIVKEQNKFAHGSTLHDAFSFLQEKLYDGSTEEERIEAFRKKFPEYDTPYSNRDLFAYHHVLTGSCRMGRESFCKDKGIDLDGSTTVREFVELTKDSYGGDVICKFPEVYGVK
nr:MAG TPA: hypothetical protein [Caudoviricetes sp.]